MLNKIILFSIRNKILVGVATLLLMAWGIWSALRIPIDAVPDITNNQIQIITNAPSLATQEVEQLVTFPIEQSMANTPGLEEMRSISRFGLSVITLVFADEVDIYFARQLINERLGDAVEHIPSGIGKPVLGPVSTGLGEIYQYVLHPAEGAEAKYNAMDLRSMQDWIVTRQLQGIPGVAEINSFGGRLKEYEVAVDPDRLRAMNITMSELFTALKDNNENTGGAYIDKQPNAYFIRSVGLVTSLNDIRSILVKHSEGGVPVLVRDVATVGFGSAPRYGAITYNGQKEAVGGIVMMLKGENSAQVVKRVKERMESVQAALPPDIVIEPYLDRTDLVDKAISTVEKNLIEGALIVIFVLVVFLGNLRAGLIVASAIPLSLLFALGMMNLFGVSANLMSLGAIDFGLIVDGAVIVVEATLHHLALRKSKERYTQLQMDEEVYQSTSKIRNSAAFGEIIILIVYVPILSLAGIEGKMFRPMAEAVGFAILGALILSLTYIPMMCAVFLPKRALKENTFSDRMMAKLQGWYQPILAGAIRARYAVLSIAAALLLVSIVIFSRMGGEFIPQLQEGDYAFHCILPQGGSLSQSIETSMLASRIIRSFPEVVEVVGKTGSAEVPTDPMPPEASDLVIVLKPRSEWTTTKDYDELAHLMMEKLEVIPGVVFESSQPIQMRFNELMTGVRQDVAVKIFGENIDTLAALAKKVNAEIIQVEGVGEPQIEQTTGLPQITIVPDRLRMANYGLSVAEVNNLISTAFAGKKAGTVYEGERRFSLVVRLDSAHRTSIEDVSNLYIPLHDGSQVPLHQVASVNFTEGPAQISRENAQRRVVVGFNVQGRDVESIVKEIQERLKKANLLPTGYYYTYGGTFENLQQASARLQIAVPIALLLIFVLLFFTFRSAGQALLIFTSIPMAAIGGVFALLIRGMPFSISAGIGFIALFGVAVLNGIVLISTFNQLKKDGMTDIMERIKQGTSMRLRPVLMTAAVASFGFLPMALSSSAGAEVQRPLASVVIGGLITATILTLLVLPLLYLLFSKRKGSGVTKAIPLLALLFFSFHSASAQDDLQAPRLSINAVVDSAIANNYSLRISDAQQKKAKVLEGTAWDINKTGVFVENEDLRPTDHNGILKMGVSQTLQWPGVYVAKRKALKEETKLQQTLGEVTLLTLKRDLKVAYYTLWYEEEKLRLFDGLDTLYTSLLKTTALRVKAGEAAGLEEMAARAKLKEIRAAKTAIIGTVKQQQMMLSQLINTPKMYLPPATKMPILELIDWNKNVNPLLKSNQQQVLVAKAHTRLEYNKLMPDFSARVFSQRLYGVSNPYTGFSVTLGLPIFASGERARIKAAKVETMIQENRLLQQGFELDALVTNAITEVFRLAKLVDYYQEEGLKEADGINVAALLAWQGGEISFAELNQYYSQTTETRKAGLDALFNYNIAVIKTNFYQNNL